LTDPQKIGFPLERDETGYPPAEAEWLWGYPADGGSWTIDNVPWYASVVSLGDVVTADRDEAGLLWCGEVVRRAGHSTIRVFISSGEQDVEELRQELTGLGCASELWSRERPLIAVDLPADADLAGVVALLDAREASGLLGWETGHLSDEHTAAWPR
jgi:hypothetical protein